jgi:hypothetical protein
LPDLADIAYFGIIDVVDTGKDYGVLDDYTSFEDHLKLYHCVGVPDDYLSLWLEGMSEVKTYYHCFSRPAKSFARYGVTLIPPESTQSLIEIIAASPVNAEEWLQPLLSTLERAVKTNKYVIHYGI